MGAGGPVSAPCTPCRAPAPRWTSRLRRFGNGLVSKPNLRFRILNLTRLEERAARVKPPACAGKGAVSFPRKGAGGPPGGFSHPYPPLHPPAGRFPRPAAPHGAPRPPWGPRGPAGADAPGTDQRSFTFTAAEQDAGPRHGESGGPRRPPPARATRRPAFLPAPRPPARAPPARRAPRARNVARALATTSSSRGAGGRRGEGRRTPTRATTWDDEAPPVPPPAPPPRGCRR